MAAKGPLLVYDELNGGLIEVRGVLLVCVVAVGPLLQPKPALIVLFPVHFGDLRRSRRIGARTTRPTSGTLCSASWRPGCFDSGAWSRGVGPTGTTVHGRLRPYACRTDIRPFAV